MKDYRVIYNFANKTIRDYEFKANDLADAFKIASPKDRIAFFIDENGEDMACVNLENVTFFDIIKDYE